MSVVVSLMSAKDARDKTLGIRPSKTTSTIYVFYEVIQLINTAIEANQFRVIWRDSEYGRGDGPNNVGWFSRLTPNQQFVMDYLKLMCGYNVKVVRHAENGAPLIDGERALEISWE